VGHAVQAPAQLEGLDVRHYAQKPERVPQILPCQLHTSLGVPHSAARVTCSRFTNAFIRKMISSTEDETQQGIATGLWDKL